MSDERSRPKGLGPEYARQFQDESVARAYPSRPPYPPRVFDLLLGLIRDDPSVILDLGCGTGDIARLLAPRAGHIDAVDPSAAMIARGRALPGGDHPNLRWIRSSAEDFTYPGPYALVVAAESLHWMDWDIVLRKIHRRLTPNGRLALVSRSLRRSPWAAELGGLIAQYSTNREYEPYDLLGELTERKLFVLEGTIQTESIPFSQTVDEYVESFHSRNGLSRDRMGSSAEEFDARLKAIIARHPSTPVLEFELFADIAWGIPAAG